MLLTLQFTSNMEKEIYQEDELASFLNEATADFKMYPARRVWHSLYNNLHPGRKWPSLAVAVFLISSIVYLGISNNNYINKHSQFAENPVLLNKTNAETTSKSNLPAKINIKQKAVPSNPVIAIIPGTVFNFNNVTNEKIIDNYITAATTGKSSELAPVVNILPSANRTDIILNSDNKTQIAEKTKLKTSNETKFSNIKNTSTSTAVLTDQPNKDAEEIELNNSIKLTKNDEPAIKPNKENILIHTELKSWLDNFAFYNKPGDRSAKSRGSIIYYVTTSVGFRSLKEKNTTTSGNSPSIAPAPVNPVITGNTIGINDRVTQHYSMNLEAGAKMMYKINEKLSLGAGLQFNYTNYIINATKLDHTIQTDIFMVGKTGNYKEARASNYANAIRNNSNVLNNSTIQFSIPIGIEMKILGENRLKWFAGAAVQPGVVLGGNAYALSSNSEFYINDPSLLRRTNINTSVETYLSYRTGAGISVIAGPQLRYQLFSTYKNKYNYTEKLYNAGIKIGLKKNF